jgi:hypothetical protein
MSEFICEMRSRRRGTRLLEIIVGNPNQGTKQTFQLDEMGRIKGFEKYLRKQKTPQLRTRKNIFSETETSIRDDFGSIPSVSSVPEQTETDPNENQGNESQLWLTLFENLEDSSEQQQTAMMGSFLSVISSRIDTESMYNPMHPIRV